MSTRADRLLDRIQFAGDFTPRVGDVFKSINKGGTFVVVGIGRRSALDNEPRVITFRYFHGDWVEWTCPLSKWGTVDHASGTDTSDYRLVDVGRDDFIWGGFSPNQTGRSYVIFKQAAGVLLRAGCRSFTTYAQAAKHWRKNSPSNMAIEKRNVAKGLFEMARRRGWLKVKRQPPVKKVRR